MLLLCLTQTRTSVLI